MVGHMKHKDELPQEDRTKNGRTFQNSQSDRTGDLSTKTPIHMEDSSHVSCYLTKTVQGS